VKVSQQGCQFYLLQPPLGHDSLDKNQPLCSHNVVNILAGKIFLESFASHDISEL